VSLELEVALIVATLVCAKNVKVLELVRAVQIQVETGVGERAIVCGEFEPKEEFVARLVVVGWVARHIRAHCPRHHLARYLGL
jgi:hypothetical protein